MSQAISLCRGMPEVSVVVPCYKDSRTLGRALNSVLAQTVPVREIIVVNDCSPESDAIERVLLDFPNVIYLKNEVNLGLAATRNAGAYAARGDVVTFLDADDELHPQKIELQLAALDPDDTVTAVTCDVVRVSGDASGHLGKGFERPLPVETVTRSSALLYRNSLTGAALMINRGFFCQFGGYDPALRSCEDFDLWLRLLDANVKVKKIALPLYAYHFNPDGLSNNYGNVSAWEIVVLNKYFSRRGHKERASFQRNAVFCVWLGKHLLRANISGDEELRKQTLANIVQLIKPRWCAIAVAGLLGLRPLVSAVAWMLGQRVRGGRG